MYTKKLGKTIAKIQKGGHRDKGTKEKKKSAFFDPKVEAKKIVERSVAAQRYWFTWLFIEDGIM